jgi:hypothetical protein
MGEHNEPVKLRSVSINMGDTEGKIEEIFCLENETILLRLSAHKLEQPLARPLEISETDLVDLLHKAIQAGILSRDFIKNLKSQFEI